MLATFMMMPMVVAMISTQPINMAWSLALLGGGFILSIVNDVMAPDGDQENHKMLHTVPCRIITNGMAYRGPEIAFENPYW